MSDDPIHRQDLVDGGHLFFSSMAPNGRSDLLDGSKTRDALIELLDYMVAGGWHFEVTSVNTDHHYDGNLGPHCHNPCGYSIDGWPLTGATEGDYVGQGTQTFRDFLSHMAKAPTLHQIGLGGEAWSDANAAAAGPTAFPDGDEDHVHLGSQ